jgi:GAF domain-containing protein
MTDRDPLFEALTRFAADMAGEFDLTDVLYQVSSEVTAVLGIRGAGVALVDPDDGRLRYAAASSADVACVEQVQEEHQSGPCVEAHRRQEPVMIADITARTDWRRYQEAAGSVGLRAVAGIPVRLGGERFGALNLYDGGVRHWSPEDVATAELFRDIAGSYLTHAALADARATTGRLQHALDSRVLLEQAKGVLAGELGIGVDEAFGRIRRHARDNNRSIRVVAEAVLHEGLRPA